MQQCYSSASHKQQQVEFSDSTPGTAHEYDIQPATLKAEVETYLCDTLQKAVVSAKSTASSREFLHHLLESLAKPPMQTTVRVNTLKYHRETVVRMLTETLAKQYSFRSLPAPMVALHPSLDDVLVIPNVGPRSNVTPQRKRVIVGLQCGIAVLRGADVYAPGVMAAPKGDHVSVYADLDGKCRRGLAVEYEEKVLFVGNGYAQLSRRDLFGSSATVSGRAIHMTDALYTAPSLNAEHEDAIFLQNLPSIVTTHVLNPQPGEVVLDMCAAPGGKTVHIGSLMKNQGCVIALDKSALKVAKLQHNVDRFGLSCIHCYTFDATHALQSNTCDPDHIATDPGPPPYPANSFDRVLVDGPCSSLGQRPQPVCNLRLRELLSYPPYQRKLLAQAVGLLKPGGILVYSTCTYTPEENECQVEWILRHYPQLQLVEQVPYLGLPGLPGFGLNSEQLKNVQRFWPVDFCMYLETFDFCVADKLLCDSIGFFIAKFKLH